MTAEEVSDSLDSMAKSAYDLRLNADQLTKGMPKLAEAAAGWGYKGKAGFASLLAQLGTLQTVTGNTEKSMMLLHRILEDMGDPEISKKLGYTPQGLIKALRQAQKEGKDAVGVYIGMIKRSEHREEILRSLPVKERAAVRALMPEYDTMGNKIRDVANATGTVAKGAENVLGGPKAKIDQMIIALEELRDEFGQLLHDLGATEAVKAVTEQIKGLIEEVKFLSALWKAIFHGGEWPDPSKIIRRRVESMTQGPAASIAGRLPFVGPAVRLGQWGINEILDKLLSEKPAPGASEEEKKKAEQEKKTRERLRELTA